MVNFSTFQDLVDEIGGFRRFGIDDEGRMLTMEEAKQLIDDLGCDEYMFHGSHFSSANEMFSSIEEISEDWSVHPYVGGEIDAVKYVYVDSVYFVYDHLETEEKDKFKEYIEVNIDDLMNSPSEYSFTRYSEYGDILRVWYDD